MNNNEDKQLSNLGSKGHYVKSIVCKWDYNVECGCNYNNYNNDRDRKGNKEPEIEINLIAICTNNLGSVE